MYIDNYLPLLTAWACSVCLCITVQPHEFIRPEASGANLWDLYLEIRMWVQKLDVESRWVFNGSGNIHGMKEFVVVIWRVIWSSLWFLVGIQQNLQLKWIHIKLTLFLVPWYFRNKTFFYNNLHACEIAPCSASSLDLSCLQHTPTLIKMFVV